MAKAKVKGPPPQMRVSQAKLDYHIKQLRKYFARAHDRAFLQMIWAVVHIFCDRSENLAEHPAFVFLLTGRLECREQRIPIAALRIRGCCFAHTVPSFRSLPLEKLA